MLRVLSFRSEAREALIVKRREFLMLGGAAVAWPLAARAQQPTRARRIGVLAGGAIESAADTQERNAAFAQTLQQLGWTNGDNVRIDYRYGLGNAANVRKYAAELVSLAPDVILASGASVLAPLLQATRTLPIVFVAVVDPVGACMCCPAMSCASIPRTASSFCTASSIVRSRMP